MYLMKDRLEKAKEYICRPGNKHTTTTTKTGSNKETESIQTMFNVKRYEVRSRSTNSNLIKIPKGQDKEAIGEKQYLKT